MLYFQVLFYVGSLLLLSYHYSQALAILPPGRNPSAHQTGGWVGPTAHLEVLEKIWVSCPSQIQTLDHPACSLVTTGHWHSHHNFLAVPRPWCLVTQTQARPCRQSAIETGFWVLQLSCHKHSTNAPYTHSNICHQYYIFLVSDSIVK
jgi:hypothetical protein